MSTEPRWYALKVLAENQSIDLNAGAPVDYSLSVGDPQYMPKYLFIHQVSAAASSAVVGLYTAAGGGGTTILAPTTLTGLTGANKCALIDLAPFVDQLSGSTIYLRLTTAAGSAATCHAAVYGFNCE